MEKKQRIDLFLNLVLVITTVGAALMYFVGDPDILGSEAVQCFKYYTTDSNILAAIGSMLYLIFIFCKRQIPQWLKVFKFVGTVSVTITLLIVLCFLAPMAVVRTGNLAIILRFFAGNVFVLHFSTPVLSIISSLFLERGNILTAKQTLFGTIPTTIYSIVYLFMVVILKKWDDWYGFTFGGRYQFVPLVMIGMFLLSLGVSFGERKIMTD